jgi:hypothetical protein
VVVGCGWAGGWFDVVVVVGLGLCGVVRGGRGEGAKTHNKYTQKSCLIWRRCCLCVPNPFSSNKCIVCLHRRVGRLKSNPILPHCRI